MQIKKYSTNSGLPSSHLSQVLYFVDVIKITLSFSPNVLAIFLIQ